MMESPRSPHHVPSLVLFGPQGRLTAEDLIGLRSHLVSNAPFSKLLATALDLPKFWSRLVELDPGLARIPGEDSLNTLVEWMAKGGSLPCGPSKLPVMLTLPINFLLQMTQYDRFARSVIKGHPHQAVLEGLELGGVHGFCLGFLGAVVVASSGDDAELVDTAIRAFQLAVCVGAYVDKDAAHTRTVCISVLRRTRQPRVTSWGHIEEIVQDFPETYISAITDKNSVTITTPVEEIPALKKLLVSAGYRVHDVPVEGRFHSSVHTAEVDRLVDFFGQAPDLRFPDPNQLRVPVRSATTGEVIRHGDLVRHVLENILLEPVNWYETVKLAMASMAAAHRCVALAGVSDHLPPSLLAGSNFRIVNMRDLAEVPLRIPTKLPPDANGLYSHEPPLTPPYDTDHVLLDFTQDRTRRSSLVGIPTPKFPSHSIAVVGMAGRFPGANSVDELWELLTAGCSTVSRAPERIGLEHLPEDSSQFNWWGNFLDDFDTFDHKFFRKSGREALACDPQQRKLLEVVHEALESSGYFGAEARSDILDYGCFIGAAENNYATNISCHAPTAYATTGTSRAFLSGAVSHHFGWTGPAMTIDTACSSSLVAVHAACRAIAAGECSRAVAGGTNIITSPHDYRDLKAAGFLSPTGQCKPFDAGADGYCRGEAVGAVVLKSLSAATQENDHILGVIVGSATNRNPKDSPITVPSSRAQAELFHQVMCMAHVQPGDVTYVEAHGTGTPVGDPIEATSLREAFGGPSRSTPLYFGSIKGNIGHSEAAAGVAGLIKALLMIRHGQIPPQAGYRFLSTKITPLEPDQMSVPETLVPWDPDERIVCVNSYGASGSNAAVLVREAPASHSGLDGKATPLQRWPLILTAASSDSLSSSAQKLLDWVHQERTTRPAGFQVADVLCNLAQRADHGLDHVVSASISDFSALLSELSSLASGGETMSVVSSRKPLVLVFGGQDSRFVGLSKTVYESSVVFRHHLDLCQIVLKSLGLDGIYPAVFEEEPLENMVTLHTALFSLQYASAMAWIKCGLNVAAIIGHSFGQLTALCVSGVLSLPDAIKLVAGRASLMQTHWGPEQGAMLFVQANRHQVEEVIDHVVEKTDYAEIACFNGPQNHVLVGTSKAIRALEAALSDTKRWSNVILSKRLKVTRGFHSMFTEALLPYLADLARGLEWRRPTIHLELCRETHSDLMPGPQLVTEHTRNPVYFQHAVERLEKKYPQATWLEVGRGSSATQLVRACLQNTDQRSLVAPRLAVSNAADSLVDATVSLWREGHGVQFWPFHRSQRDQYCHLSLPPYQFQKTRHWLPYMPRSAAHAPRDPDGLRPEQTEPPDLLSLVKADKSGESVFRISPKSARFQALVAGHVMCGHAAMPASLYIEIASSAALMLQEDLRATSWVPAVENLMMEAPVGLDPGADVIMTMKRLQSPWPSWSFSIHVEGPSHSPEMTTGSVLLRQRTDPQVSQELRRFEVLTGYDRCEMLLHHPDAEAMKGTHIYRAFSQVVEYSGAFMGIKTIACLGKEAAGTVRFTSDARNAPEQKLTDTPVIDSFMQFGGFLSNYFNETASKDSLMVCHHIQRVQFGPLFSPEHSQWFVFANTTSTGPDNASADVYVFETQSRNLVFTALGMDFLRTPRASLARMLRGNELSVESGAAPNKIVAAQVQRPLEASEGIRDAKELLLLAETSPKKNAISSRCLTKRAEVIRIAANIADVPEHDFSGKTSLAEIGIDSLGATEMISDIAIQLNVSIDLATFLLLPDIDSLVAHVDSRLGLSDGGEDAAEGAAVCPDNVETSKGPEKSESGDSRGLTNGHVPKGVSESEPANFHSTPPSTTLTRSLEVFEDVRLSYDKLGAEVHALDYWSKIYPDDARLTLAYITEAFRALGCDLAALGPGKVVPELANVLTRHDRLVRQLFRFLEEEGVIESSGNGFVRDNRVIDPIPGEKIFSQIVEKSLPNAALRHLLRAVGSQLADCLVGAKNALQILFGSKANKKWLDALYGQWPMLVAATHLLGRYLCQLFSNSTNKNTRPYRILEVGAGTGGTTQHVVRLLTERGIPFRYHFTDLSASLVHKAKASFAYAGTSMTFGVLDIEQNPPADFADAFDVIIGTNCVHATRYLTCSLTNLRRMLRPDGGVLALVEMTPPPGHTLYAFDLIVGLLEGWWLFEDGREHSLAGTERWRQAMAGAGFDAVRWSDGETLSARTVRVIAGFRGPWRGDSRANREVESRTLADVTVEEVVYKTVGSLKIHADVYCPAVADPMKKMPIALMIHGGSHIIFSRKDIRPPQTRILLEMGFLPVSLDHRLCPETRLVDGPMVDICDAVSWARNTLPFLKLSNPDVQPDADNVVVVGWSSGGQLALSTGWTIVERGLKPPNAILAFYCPTDYEDEWWQGPIQPIGAEDTGEEYDVLAAVQDEPLSGHSAIGAWEPLSDPRIRTDPRARIILHMNWKAQTLPVVITGLPSRIRSATVRPEVINWNALPQPPVAEIRRCSPLAQVRAGRYTTPTFLVHGTADDLIPWQQSVRTFEEMRDRGIDARLVVVPGAPHICDGSRDPGSEGWRTVLEAYRWLGKQVFRSKE